MSNESIPPKGTVWLVTSPGYESHFVMRRRGLTAHEAWAVLSAPFPFSAATCIQLSPYPELVSTLRKAVMEPKERIEQRDQTIDELSERWTALTMRLENKLYDFVHHGVSMLRDRGHKQLRALEKLWE